MPSAEGVFAVEAAGEVPVQLQAEEVEGKAVAEGGLAIDQESVLAEAERLSGEARGADVEEEIAADALQHEARHHQRVDQREAHLEIGEAGPIADDRLEIVAAQRVQSAEVIEVREIAARVSGEEAAGQQRARGELQVLAPLHGVVVREDPVSLEVGCVGGADLVAAAGDRAELLVDRAVAGERRIDDREVVAALEED